MGKFVIKTTASGVKFNLKAKNGEIIGTSQIYSSEAACRQGILSVINTAPIAQTEDQTAEAVEAKKHPKFEMYLDKKGEHRFRLKARNGEIILASEGYTNKAGCLNGIASVCKNAADAEVEKE